MKRSVPLWVFLFCLLLGSLLTVAFGSVVISTQSGSNRSGLVGEIAVEVALFPKLAKNTLVDLWGLITGSYVDDQMVVPREQTDLSGFEAIPAPAGVRVAGLRMRAGPAPVPAGWRLLLGVFEVNGTAEHAALLLSPALGIAKSWILSEAPVAGVELQRRHRKFPHGVVLLPDGSLIFAFDGGSTLQRIGRCGERKWATAGRYHHALTLSDTGRSVWTLRENHIVEVSVADGAVVRSLSMQDIGAANPAIDILQIRVRHRDHLSANPRNTAGTPLRDHLHLNDVDPLPSSFAARFEGFEAGDLLVSARSLNLVFVVDPESLRIKWWRIGAAQRQHDPDWHPNGEITVFNNRMSRDYSEVIAIEVGSLRRRVLFDGRVNDFYTRIRGKHQLTAAGSLLVSSPQQGRAFEVNKAGEVVLEILNLKPGSDTRNYALSEMSWLPADFVSSEDIRCEH